MRIIWAIAAFGFPTVGVMIAVAFWQSLTQRRGPAGPKGGRQVSAEFGERVRRRGPAYEVREFEADLLMFDIDEQGRRARVALARRKGAGR